MERAAPRIHTVSADDWAFTISDYISAHYDPEREAFAAMKLAAEAH